MTRYSTVLRPVNHDGTSQRNRALPALAPEHARIDERTNAELVAFVQKFTARLRYFAPDEQGGVLRENGTWAAFAQREGISVQDIVAYIAEPERFAGERARWLGRPHFALLLAFIELLGHAREQLGALTGKQLDYYFRDVLRMQLERAQPDHAAVLFRLANRVASVRMPAGTVLVAGRDSSGVARHYRTERELLINRTAVVELRSVYVNRQIVEIPTVREIHELSLPEVFDRMLALALGEPKPGDSIREWRGEKVNLTFFQRLREPPARDPLLREPSALDVTTKSLHLEHFELRALMQLVRQRTAGVEWAEINRLLGKPNPLHPRDFAGNFVQAIAPQVLDFANDGIPQVDDLDDLYAHRSENLDDPVRKYIEVKLKNIGYEKFVAVMQLKTRIDAEWAEINRILELAGRRQRHLPSWRFPSQDFDASAFDHNLATALPGEPPAWPWGVASIFDYEELVRNLEVHLSMSVERIERLSTFALKLTGDAAHPVADRSSIDWSEVDRILSEAHAEHVYAIRRSRLETLRGESDSSAGFDRLVTCVLSQPESSPTNVIPWADARRILQEKHFLEAQQLAWLDDFRAQFDDPKSPNARDWSNVYRLLELAQRHSESIAVPIAQQVKWRNLFAYDDARSCVDDATQSPRWKTFGRVAACDPDRQPPAQFGWELRSPLLSLSQGKRTVVLTLGLSIEGFDPAGFLTQDQQSTSEVDRIQALKAAWLVQLSTKQGWIEPEIKNVRLPSADVNSDYWSLTGLERRNGGRCPALQLELVVDVKHPPITAIPGLPQPSLRIMMRQCWDDRTKCWTTSFEPFQQLKLVAVHVQASVEELTALLIQQEDRAVDPSKPFEPFGSRPEVGSRMYLSHPELVRERLDSLTVEFEWIGMPADLNSHYARYPEFTVQSLKFGMILVDSHAELALSSGEELFASATSRIQRLTKDIKGALATKRDFSYRRRPDLPVGGDLRLDDRYLRFELQSDFGHVSYPSLAARYAAKLAAALNLKAISTEDAVVNYQVNPPYTPKLKRLSVGYTVSTEISLDEANGIDHVLHVHPFGESPIQAEDFGLFPRYDQAGELYIGLRELRPPQRLSLLLQLAEGTSDPELERSAVSWSCLDGDRWKALELLFDSTRGLINSGIVEFDLPSVAASTRLPKDCYWLRVSIRRNTSSVCDMVGIHAQAATVCFDDRGNAADHFARPLPAGSISRLAVADARIAKIEQPYTSYGGITADRPEQFRLRVSERLRHKQRALSPWDYERLVLQRFGRIYKVKCLSATGGEPGQVVVVVIPDIRDALPGDAFAPKVSADLLAEIQEYLTARAPSSASIVVRNAQYVPVLVRLSVRFRPGQDKGLAKRRLNDDLVRFLSPWAYDQGAELTIGGRVYANSILDFADRCDYVDYVTDIKLFRGGSTDEFVFIAPTDDYCAAADKPDQVLVPAADHVIDLIPDRGYDPATFTGIDYMKIELDFIVH